MQVLTYSQQLGSCRRLLYAEALDDCKVYQSLWIDESPIQPIVKGKLEVAVEDLTALFGRCLSESKGLHMVHPGLSRYVANI